MPPTYTLPNGEARTTCPEHRRDGYAIQLDGRMTCRGCGQDAALHESNAETLARKDREAEAVAS